MYREGVMLPSKQNTRVGGRDRRGRVHHLGCGWYTCHWQGEPQFGMKFKEEKVGAADYIKSFSSCLIGPIKAGLVLLSGHSDMACGLRE